ncbi:hypothetical protein [Actinomycetospora sp.]|uniref:hypothetical protein n=1 Tax=Actinomycetospora sp. TaxID=1872135 RepID=UPI0039C8A946
MREAHLGEEAVDLGPVAAHDLPLRVLECRGIRRPPRVAQRPAGRLLGDDLEEQLGEQEAGGVPEMAPAVEVELHGRGTGVDEDAAAGGVVDGPVALIVQVAQVVALEEHLAVVARDPGARRARDRGGGPAPHRRSAWVGLVDDDLAPRPVPARPRGQPPPGARRVADERPARALAVGELIDRARGRRRVDAHARGQVALQRQDLRRVEPRPVDEQLHRRRAAGTAPVVHRREPQRRRRPGGLGRGRPGGDAEVAARGLAHVEQQPVDGVADAVRGGGVLEVPQLGPLRRDGSRQLGADRPGQRRDEGVPRVEPLAVVADDVLAGAEPLGQHGAAQGAEEVLGPHLVLVLEELAVEHRRSRHDDEPVGAVVAAQRQLGVLGTPQRQPVPVRDAVVDEGAGPVGADESPRGRVEVAHPLAALHLPPVLDVHQVDEPARQDLPQVHVVGDRAQESLVVRDGRGGVVDDDRDLRAVRGDVEASPVVVERGPVAAVVVEQVGAVGVAEQVDGGQPPVAHRLDAAVPRPEHRLLEPPPEVAAPRPLAPRERAVRRAVGDDRGGLPERDALGPVGDLQGRPLGVPFVDDPDAPGRARLVGTGAGVAVVAVGDQFDERLVHRGEAARVDPDHALVDGDGRAVTCPG